MQIAPKINFVSPILPAMIVARFIAAQLGQMLPRVVKSHAQVDRRLTVQLELHVSLRHRVIKLVHTSVGQVLRMPLRPVLSPAPWGEAINVQMAKAVLRTHSAMKMEQTQCLQHHLSLFLLHLWILIIVGIVSMRQPYHAPIPVLMVRLRNALEIFSVLQAHHAKLRDHSSAGRVGMKQHLHALCHVKVA